MSVVIIEAYRCYQLHTKFYPALFSRGYVHVKMKPLGTINGDFNVTGQLLIRVFALVRYWRTKRVQCESTSFIDFEKAYDSPRK
jgi:hypothetical protein